MSSVDRKKSVMNMERDLLSELPVDIKHKILEHLPTIDAARTAILSKIWGDVWSRHSRLVLDCSFFESVSKCKGIKICKPGLVYQILSSRAAPVKTFTLSVHSSVIHTPLQADIDEWCCLLTSNGVEQLTIFAYGVPNCILPGCIFSCPTIKRLELGGFVFKFPENVARVLPCVSSLYLSHVEFKRNAKRTVYSFPNLETLSVGYCFRINNFKIYAPKLQSLFAKGNLDKTGWRWFTSHWKSIKTLWLSCELLAHIIAAVAPQKLFPSAINFQVLKLCCLDFANVEQLTSVMQLLQRSPKLCEIEIMPLERAINVDDDAASRLLEDPNSGLVLDDLKMLRVLKFIFFGGSRPLMLFTKTILSKSPQLLEVVIHKNQLERGPAAREIAEKLLLFPCASKEAELVFKKGVPLHILFDFLQGKS